MTNPTYVQQSGLHGVMRLTLLDAGRWRVTTASVIIPSQIEGLYQVHVA